MRCFSSENAKMQEESVEESIIEDQIIESKGEVNALNPTYKAFRNKFGMIKKVNFPKRLYEVEWS